MRGAQRARDLRYRKEARGRDRGLGRSARSPALAPLPDASDSFRATTTKAAGGSDWRTEWWSGRLCVSWRGAASLPVVSRFSRTGENNNEVGPDPARPTTLTATDVRLSPALPHDMDP